MNKDQLSGYAIKAPLAVPATKTDASSQRGQSKQGSQSSEQMQLLAQTALHRFLLDMVALVYDVPLEQLMSPSRGKREIAFARQVAMYLAHTGGGLSLSAVGRLFARDRTTVAHACALVEDARDDDRLDQILDHLQRAIGDQMQLFALSVGARAETRSFPRSELCGS